jgi:hypothetical protein
MKTILNDFFMEISTAVLGLVVYTLKDFLGKNLEKFYLWIIKSRFTPSRLSYQEKEAMKLGVWTGISSQKKKVYASSIYLFSIHRNGRDVFRQHLQGTDVSELDGYDITGFDKLIEKMRKHHFINISDTSKPRNEDDKIFCEILNSIGYKSVNFILIENKYTIAFFLVVHKDYKTTSEEDIEYLQKSLLKFKDPIITLYLK